MKSFEVISSGCRQITSCADEQLENYMCKYAARSADLELLHICALLTLFRERQDQSPARRTPAHRRARALTAVPAIAMQDWLSRPVSCAVRVSDAPGSCKRPDRFSAALLSSPAQGLSYHRVPRIRTLHRPYRWARPSEPSKEVPLSRSCPDLLSAALCVSIPVSHGLAGLPSQHQPTCQAVATFPFADLRHDLNVIARRTREKSLMMTADKRAAECRSWPVLQVWSPLMMGSRYAVRLAPARRQSMVRQYRYVERMSLKAVFTRERKTLRSPTSCTSHLSDIRWRWRRSRTLKTTSHSPRLVPMLGFKCLWALFLPQSTPVDSRLLMTCSAGYVRVHIPSYGQC